jgi:hypothetical protein
MFITSRPHAGEAAEPALQRAVLLLEKLVRDVTPEEVQIVLGRLLDTCRLLVALPQDKVEAWLQTLNAIISDRHCLKETPELLEGQLCHASCVIPLAHCFQNQGCKLAKIPDHTGDGKHRCSHFLGGTVRCCACKTPCPPPGGDNFRERGHHTVLKLFSNI